jgi:UDPglucose 6-dehydrogenase
MVLTEWDEFQDMDPVAVGEQVAQRNMVDGRYILDPVAWRKAGWRYRALGRP